LEQTQELQFNPDYAELPAPRDRILAGKVPTLEQVLMDLKPTGMEVKIELKGAKTAEPVVELVDRLGMAHQVSFSSFNHDEIATVRKMRPQTRADGTYVYRTGALFDVVPTDYISRALRVGASEIHIRYDDCTTDRIAEIHKAGLGSMAWYRGPIGMKDDTTDKYWDIGNEDESCYETLIETGVQQLCVNKPDVLAAMLRRKDREQQQQQQQQKSQEQAQTQFVRTPLPPDLGSLDPLGLDYHAIAQGVTA
jgi:glycerophosphoryl diester phosphodiesterase